MVENGAVKKFTQMCDPFGIDQNLFNESSYQIISCFIGGIFRVLNQLLFH